MDKILVIVCTGSNATSHVVAEYENLFRKAKINVINLPQQLEDNFSVEDEQERLLSYDRIVFVFSLFATTIPWQLKKYIDLIWDRSLITKLDRKLILMIAITNTGENSFQFTSHFGLPLSNYLISLKKPFETNWTMSLKTQKLYTGNRSLKQLRPLIFSHIEFAIDNDSYEPLRKLLWKYNI